MRKNIGKSNCLYPQPVLIIATYDENGNVDVMNAAWGGVSGVDTISICLDSSHKTTANLKLHRDLTISPGIKEYVTECDYVGMVSANNNPHKMDKINFTYTNSTYINAPIINELPLTFECHMISYDEESEILVAKIINTSIDESILTNDKIDLNKFHPIVFDGYNHNYIELGEIVAKAFCEGLKLK